MNNDPFFIPGDKSISHRALFLAARSKGVTEIHGLLEAEDIFSTINCLKQLGIKVWKENEIWLVEGAGPTKPAGPLDCGNSGTTARLMMGFLADCDFEVEITGDESLQRRPMKRAMFPLELMGVKFQGEALPLKMHGTKELKKIEYVMPVPSAQVKSAIMLAGSKVIEPVKTRDHTEIMLKNFANKYSIPKDPSAAAFLAVAALINKVEVKLEGICINPFRVGIYKALQKMGANIEFINKRLQHGEQVADIVVKQSKLQSIELESEVAPSMIDEYPVLAVSAAFAKGRSVFNGLRELRYKECDRLNAIENGLNECGIKAKAIDDTLHIEGGIPRGGNVCTFGDHRVAMSFLVLGTLAQKNVTVDDYSCINNSFPGFEKELNKLLEKREAI